MPRFRSRPGSRSADGRPHWTCPVRAPRPNWTCPVLAAATGHTPILPTRPAQNWTCPTRCLAAPTGHAQSWSPPLAIIPPCPSARPRTGHVPWPLRFGGLDMSPGRCASEDWTCPPPRRFGGLDMSPGRGSGGPGNRACTEAAPWTGHSALCPAAATRNGHVPRGECLRMDMRRGDGRRGACP